MDGFFVLVIALVVAGTLGFAAGRLTLEEIRSECLQNGQMEIKNTIFSCKPIAARINDRIVPFQEADRE